MRTFWFRSFLMMLVVVPPPVATPAGLQLVQSQSEPAADKSPSPPSEQFHELAAELAELTAPPVDAKRVKQLIDLDQRIAKSDRRDVRGLQTKTLKTLALADDPGGIEYVRGLFETNAARRHHAAWAVSLAANRRPVNGQDWRYLVRSLTVVEGEHAVSVLQTLARFRQRATRADWIRRVLLIGLSLPAEQQPHAIALLDHWSGRSFPAAATSQEALREFQNWFRKKWPNEPDPVLPVDPPDSRWKYGPLRLIIERSKPSPASLAAGRAAF